jgi:hypothetical protein
MCITGKDFTLLLHFTSVTFYTCALLEETTAQFMYEQKVLGRTNHLLSSDITWKTTCQIILPLLHSCLLLRNVFTKLLPSNDVGHTHTDTLTSYKKTLCSGL